MAEIKNSLSYRLKDLHGPRPILGETGVEIEVEGSRLPIGQIVRPYWQAHTDNSLRGESMEYSFKIPINFDDVPVALDHLLNSFTANQSVIHDSPRTSVHVHLNVQNLYMQEVYTLITAYILLENLFVAYAGADRIGNLFCLRSSDAELLPMKIIEGLQNGRLFNDVLGDNYRYASQNLAALRKFGSIEYRALRGTVDRETILEWVGALRALRNIVWKYTNPLELYNGVIRLGIEGFLFENFPEAFVRNLLKIDGYQKLVDDNLDYVLMISHATKWLDLVKLRKDDGTTIEQDKKSILGELPVIRPFNRNAPRFVSLAAKGFLLTDEDFSDIQQWEEEQNNGVEVNSINLLVDVVNHVRHVRRRNQERVAQQPAPPRPAQPRAPVRARQPAQQVGINPFPPAAQADPA